MQEKLTELAGGSGWQFSSSTALDVILDQYLNERPTGTTPREILQTLVRPQSQFIREQHSFVPTICFEIDDQNEEFFEDSLYVYSDNRNIKQSIRDMMREHGIVAGMAVSAYYVEHGDTVTNTMSVSKLRALREHDGWEIGNGGWDEKLWFSDQTGRLATGAYTQAEFDSAFDFLVLGNQRALRDTLFLGTPRYYSYSYSSATSRIEQVLASAGIEYGVVGSQTQSVGSQQGTRPNRIYPLDCARWGAWGAGGGGFGVGAGGRAVTAIPGYHLNPYEIYGSMGEAVDTAATNQLISRALQTNGLLVWYSHTFSAWESSLQGKNGVKLILSRIGNLIAQGRMRCVVPSQAFDLYYKAPIGASAGFYADSFQDLDNDSHLDWWGSDNMGQTASDTARITLMPGTIRHGGKRGYSLNWGADLSAGSINHVLAGASNIDSTWEATWAVMGVPVPQGGGFTAQFEIWAICDTALGGAEVPLAGTGKYANEEFGVVFYAPIEAFTNQQGISSSQSFRWNVTSTASDFSLMASYPVTASTVYPYPSNCIKFTKRNNIRRAAHEWAHCVFTYDVPEVSDYLLIALWKDRWFPANEVIVSDYKLTFFKRGTNQ
jgi:hypothetical protein